MAHKVQVEQRDAEPRTTLPPAGERVVVQCQGYRCLAYRDREGKWRDAHGNTELPNVLRVLYQF